MQLTPNYKLKKPEGTDQVDIQDFNDNADLIDAALKKKSDSAGGDISEMTIKTLDSITTDFPIPEAGEKPREFLGKVKKFFVDTKNSVSYTHLISRLQDLKESGDAFEFIVIRDSFDTNMDVTLEDYKVSDDVKEGLDLVVSITMKEARHYGTKIMNFTIIEDQATPTAETPEENRPAEQPQAKTYTVKSGDCLWNIAKKQLGDGSRWKEIHDLNRDKISNPNLIHPGLVLVMP